MTPERWKQIEELYHAAAGRTPDDRDPFLARVCAGDDELRQQVEALLDETVREDGFVGGPALPHAADLVAGDAGEGMTGRSVGTYDVQELLGWGGMGEVYRAHDRKLGRDVAIKVLPRAFTSDPQRLARFEREARMLAAVNHPAVCAIYGVEESGATRYLILELVEGLTLAEILAEHAPRGGLPLREIARIARQMAEALEVAHDKGIVHRDLKPANIKITPEGIVKVLDFGLARPIAAEGRSDLTDGPVVINGKRSEGPIIGTAAYMSPEQARGLPIDKRSDIWAFGCVLYEMLAGRQVFAGETVSDTIAKILEREPDWSALPAWTPPAIRRLLLRCLSKDPKDRLRDIGDARIEIDALGEQLPGELETRAGPRRRWPTTLAAVAVVLSALAALASWIPRTESPSSLGDRLAKAKYTWVTEWEGVELDAAISADGKFAAFVADASGAFHVWRTQLGTGTFTDLTPDQDDERNRLNRPVGFSTDGTSIWLSGHPSGRRLRQMPFTGGALRPFLEDHAINVAWSADDTRLVYFRADDDGDPVFVAERDGANARPILVGKAGEHNHFPTWSPDGKWIYYVHFTDEAISADLWRVPAIGGVPERLTEQYRDVRYPTPVDGRTVLYVARDEDGSGPWLWAVDVETRVPTRVGVGPDRYLSVAASADTQRLVATLAKSTATLWSVPILDRVADEQDASPYAFSPSRALAPRFGGGGSLLYLSSTGSGDGLWRAQGTSVTEMWQSSEGALHNPVAVASNGRMAVRVRTRGRARLTLVSPDGAVRRSIADGIDVRGTAAWSPGADWIVTGGLDSQGPGLFKIPVDGGAPVRIATGQALDPVWSPDGDLIVYVGLLSKGTAPLLAVRPDGRAVPFPPIRTSAQGSGGVRFLPGGKAIVYLLGATGNQQFWRLDLASHRIRQLARLPGNTLTNSFDITPDGSQIVFDRLRELSDIVQIDLPRLRQSTVEGR